MKAEVPPQFSVLIVDDDPGIIQLIKCNLDDGHTRIFEAATGLDGLKTLSKTRVDLIIMDVRLPDFNGWGILSLIRLTETLSRIPVVMVSVEPPVPSLAELLQPDDYIQKPFDIRDLLSRVKSHLSPNVPSREVATNGGVNDNCLKMKTNRNNKLREAYPKIT